MVSVHETLRSKFSANGSKRPKESDNQLPSRLCLALWSFFGGARFVQVHEGKCSNIFSTPLPPSPSPHPPSIFPGWCSSVQDLCSARNAPGRLTREARGQKVSSEISSSRDLHKIARSCVQRVNRVRSAGCVLCVKLPMLFLPTHHYWKWTDV